MQSNGSPKEKGEYRDKHVIVRWRGRNDIFKAKREGERETKMRGDERVNRLIDKDGVRRGEAEMTGIEGL